MEVVEGMSVQDNDTLFLNIVKVFKSKIIPVELSKKFTNESILIQNKEDYILSFVDIKHCFLGYGVKTIQEALDDYEFYLYLIGLLNTTGNIYRSFVFLNDDYREELSVAFYNYQTDTVEYFEKRFVRKLDKHQDNSHLFFLEGIKTLVHHLLIFVVEKNLDLERIEMFKHKLKEKQVEGD